MTTMDNCQCVCNLADLIEEHYSLLYRYAFRLSGSVADAEDLTQQTFLMAQPKLHQLRESSHAKAWLCAIVRNVFRKSLRRNGNSTVPLGSISEPASNLPINSMVDLEEIQNALNELSEEFRSPLILYYFSEFSYKEISEQLEVPMGTVMSRLARAKAYLRKRLELREEVIQEDSRTTVGVKS